MTLTLRILLIVASLLTLLFTIHKIRQARIDISDTVFWIFFSLCLLLMSISPEIMNALADFCGVQSPVNMVFLLTVAALVYKSFTLTLKVSTLELKLKMLAVSSAVKETIQTQDEGKINKSESEKAQESEETLPRR